MVPPGPLTRRGSVTVVGGGVVGAASALELALRGWSVTLLDPHPLESARASSADVSKMVRMDYGGDAFYHELAEAALAGWDRWNAEWPRPLYHEDGFLVLSRGPMEAGGFEHESWRLLRERGHHPERLGSGALSDLFPAWRAGAYADGYLNRRGGWAESSAVVERLLSLGGAAGVASLKTGFASLAPEGSRVGGVVTTDGEVVRADRVVVAAGAWTPTLLPRLSDRLRATAQPVLYFASPDPRRFGAERFPPWAADISGSGWYGFPALVDGRVKLGHHGPGAAVHPDDPGEVPEAHVERARDFLADAIPELAGARLVGRRVCMYCDSSDGDLLVDHVPGHEGLVVASGGSGHAFKFAPLLGGLVADVVEGRPNPWSARFAWRDAGGARSEAARFAGD